MGFVELLIGVLRVVFGTIILLMLLPCVLELLDWLFPRVSWPWKDVSQPGRPCDNETMEQGKTLVYYVAGYAEDSGEQIARGFRMNDDHTVLVDATSFRCLTAGIDLPVKFEMLLEMDVKLFNDFNATSPADIFDWPVWSSDALPEGVRFIEMWNDVEEEEADG